MSTVWYNVLFVLPGCNRRYENLDSCSKTSHGQATRRSRRYVKFSFNLYFLLQRFTFVLFGNVLYYADGAAIPHWLSETRPVTVGQVGTV